MNLRLMSGLEMEVLRITIESNGASINNSGININSSTHRSMFLIHHRRIQDHMIINHKGAEIIVSQIGNNLISND